MAARIVHFGLDLAYRVAILSHAGFDVEDCSSSLPQFANALQSLKFDAVILTEAEGRAGVAKQAATLARSHCKAPVIMFRSAAPSRDDSEFDLVIPSLTPPNVWLEAIQSTIESSRRIVSESQAVRDGSRMLVEQSAEVRRQAETVRKRSQQLRREAEMILDERDPESEKGDEK